MIIENLLINQNKNHLYFLNNNSSSKINKFYLINKKIKIFSVNLIF